MKKLFFIFFLGFLFIAPGLTQAACPTGIVPCNLTGDCTCTLCHFFVMFDRIIKFFLIPDTNINGGIPLIPALAALLIAIGGFMYIIAYTGAAEAGPAMMNRAKSLFKSVIWGLLICYGAWLIVSMFFMVIGVKRDTPWNEINCDVGSVSTTTPTTTPTTTTTTTTTPPPATECSGGVLVGGYCYQSQSIANQYGDASPALQSLLTCMGSRLGNNGTISSISDNNIAAGTCQVWSGGGYTSGCQHSQNSCHYGGRNCRDQHQSYATDFVGDSSAIQSAATACGGRARNEGSHTHVSIGGTDCDCDRDIW